jgi:hypothetical protein
LIRLATALLGIVWIALAAAKAHRPQALQDYLMAYFGSAAGFVVWVVVTLEFALGLAILASFNSSAVWPRRIRLASLGYTAALVAVLLFGGQAVRSCGCLGSIQADEASRKLALLGCLVILGTAAIGRVDTAGSADGVKQA